MKKFRFLEDGLAGDVYYDEVNKSVATALIATGFPAFPGPNEFVVALVDAGFVVVHPYCHGTFDSDGEFTPASMLQTYSQVGALLAGNALTNAVSRQQFTLPSPPILSLGHSFGCLIALRTSHLIPQLRGLVLAAPAFHYRPEYGLKEDGPKHFADVARAWPRTYRLGSTKDWSSILSGQDVLPNNTNHPNLREVLVVVGEKDKYFEIEPLRKHASAIVSAYVGSAAKTTFIVLPQVGHPIAELASAPSLFSLAEFAKRLV